MMKKFLAVAAAASDGLQRNRDGTYCREERHESRSCSDA